MVLLALASIGLLIQTSERCSAAQPFNRAAARALPAGPLLALNLTAANLSAPPASATAAPPASGTASGAQRNSKKNSN